MTKKYDYKIFPETWKARVLVIIAGVLGLALMAGYLVTIVSFGPRFGVGLWGWWDKIEVEYVNRTDERALVYIDERLKFTIEPGETVTDSDYKIEWWWDREVQVFDDRSRVLFAAELDRDDLKRRDYRIVIDD